jgi:hypothetical protein
VNWQIRTGSKSVLGVEQAADIVVGRLEYLAEHGSRCNGQRLLDEAIQYSRLIRDWVRENAPRVELELGCDPLDYAGVRPGGKPGPMSDG